MIFLPLSLIDWALAKRDVPLTITSYFHQSKVVELPSIVERVPLKHSFLTEEWVCPPLWKIYSSAWRRLFFPMGVWVTVPLITYKGLLALLQLFGVASFPIFSFSSLCNLILFLYFLVFWHMGEVSYYRGCVAKL